MQYQIVVGLRNGKQCAETAGDEDPRRYEVAVTRADQPVATGKAMSFYETCCGDTEITAANRCGPEVRDNVLKDVRNRVALYLAWRDLVEGAPRDSQQSP